MRPRQLGAVLASVSLVAVAIPAVAHGQGTDPGSLASSDSTADSTTSTESGSAGDLVGLIPEEIVIGGPGLGGGSEGLRDLGSGEIPDAALSVGQAVGSVAPLEAVGSAGGSAAASVASSGSLPGSVYANPTGSIGSGTIGLGSIAIPEFIFPVLSVNFGLGYVAAMDERQAAGELFPHELTFWHGVVEGSAEGGALVEAAAEGAGAEVPGSLAGSIDSVQVAALEDPFEEQEKLRAELAAEAAAEGEDVEFATGGDEKVDDDEVTAGNDDAPAGAADTAVQAGADAAAGADAGAAGTAVPGADASDADAAAGDFTPRLAVTGVETVMLAAGAVMTLLLGGLVLAFTRRRA